MMRLPNIKFRYMLIIVFLFSALIPIVVLGYFSYQTLKREITFQAEQRLIEIIQKNNEIIDSKLKDVTDSALMINVDNQIYDIILEMDTSDYGEMIETNNEIKQILSNYFNRDNGKYSVHLITSYFRFGEEDKNFYPDNEFFNSELYKQAIDANGAMVWVPTYDYLEMFNLNYLESSTSLEYRKMFSAVKCLNVSTVRSGTISKLPDAIEKPILVINYQETFFQSIIMNSIEPDIINDITYTVLDRDGYIIANSDKSVLGQIDSDNWYTYINGKNGYLNAQIGIEDKIICYAVSDVTNWISAVMISPEVFTRNILRTTSRFMVMINLIIISATIMFIVLASQFMSHRIHTLIQSIERIGTGDFSTLIQFDEKDEFAFFYKKLNWMNNNLKQLIHENYVVKLHERDAEIVALNVQLNPHFLQNTLNVINWTALNGDLKLTSKMIVGLSRMLQYTSNNRSEMSLLKDDINWLEQYLFIMKLRYEDIFDIKIDIDPILFEIRVPKLFLQPLIENSIIHGFKNLRTGGQIIVTGAVQGEIAIFSVEDNGCGIAESRLDEIFKEDGNNIGLSNVNKRIKLIYGNEFGLQIISNKEIGTSIIVRIPMREDSLQDFKSIEEV